MNKKIIKILLVILILLAVPLCAYAAEGDTDIGDTGEGDGQTAEANEALAGTVSIVSDSTPQYDETITADTTNITNNTGTLSYQWTRNGVDVAGQMNAAYTLVQEDIGADVAVNVTSSVETGTLTSAAVSVGKADKAAPAAPVLLSKDHYTVTLTISEGCEYKIDGGSFSNDNVFANLQSHTEYTFYQRYAETATHKASPASEGLSVTTDYVELADTTCDISTLNAGDIVMVSGSVTLTGTQAICVKCSVGAELTLNSVTIDVSGAADKCAIEFLGTGNKLILKGSNKTYSGSGKAGIETTGGLTISGSGSLYVKGGANGAGIGGSSGQNAGTIAISLSGGKITAIGGANGAGIGGGANGAGGAVSVSKGEVFAKGSSADDIGGGASGTSGSLSISGISAVFLKNNSAPTASTSTHTLHSDQSVSDGKAYGYSISGLWTEGDIVYAYINYCTVSFETNGADSIASQEILAGQSIEPPADPSRTALEFIGWYSDSALTSAFNVDGDKVYEDMTLYARWDAAITITVGEKGSVSPDTGITVTLGDDLILTCTPVAEYHVGEVTSLKNHTIVDNGDNTYTVKNISSGDTITVVFDADNLLGVVKISHDGLPEFGDKLEANIDGITNNPETAKLEYQWTRDGKDIEKATNETYMLVKDDIGHRIAVNVSSTEKEGFITSEQIDKIQKAMKPAPRAPLLKDKTTTTITLFEVEGCEYQMEGDIWRESNVFENLEPETEYVFYQRYAQTDSYKVSNPSFCVKITTRGYSIEKLDFASDTVTMHKGDEENAASVMQYSMTPKDVENDEIYWASSNERVAIVDSESGVITAVGEGKTVITITGADTTNGVITDTCTLQVFDPTPEDSTAFLGGLSGRLTDMQGSILSGYTIILYSNPIAVKTDSQGEFSLDYVPYTSHILVVENADSVEIGRFIVNWELGEKYRANIDNDHNVINITYTEFTTSINLPIVTNNDFTDIDVKTVEGISYVTEEEETTTVSKKLYVLVLLGIIVACIIGVGYILYIGRIQKDEYYEDEYIEGHYEQTLLEENPETNNNTSRDEDKM